MSISVLQRQQAGNAAVGTTIANTYGSNVTAGSALIVCAWTNGAASTLSAITDTLGSIFVPLGTFTGALNVMKAWIVDYVPIGGAETITVTTGFNDSTTHIFEVAGLGRTRAFDKSHQQNQTSATALDTLSTATTTYANELLLGCFVNGNATTLAWTIGAGYSNLLEQDTAFCNTITEEQIVSATGTYNATATLAANSTNEMSVILTFADTPQAATKVYIHQTRPHSFSPGLAR